MTDPVWRKPTRCESASCPLVAEDGDHVLISSTGAPDMVARLTREEFATLRAAFVDGDFADIY